VVRIDEEHTNFIVKVEIRWAKDPRCIIKFLKRIPTNTLKNSSRIKVLHNKIVGHIDFFRNKINVTQSSFKLEIWHGLAINLTHINYNYENQRGF
jgi:hypothetical protein